MSIYKEPEKYLRKSIESILNQSFSDLEYIVIVDNPEYDLGIELVKEYAKNDKRLQYHINQQNIGLTASLNRALQYVTGQYVARMDADDIAEPDRLKLQMEYLNKHKLGLVGSSVRRISESGSVVMELTNQSYSPQIISKLLHFDNCVPHPTWLVKRSVYEKLGGYREIKACEDYDFLLRAVKNKIEIGICDKITLNYRINTSGISRSNSLRQLLTADYLQKNFSRIDYITQSEIDAAIKPLLTPTHERKYETAVNRLSSSIESIKRGRYIDVISALSTVFISRFIIINIRKILKMRIIKRRA